MLISCSPEKKDALVFTILIQRLRNKAGDAGTENLIKTHGLQGSGWGLSADGVLAKDVPGGLDILTLAKRALKGNEKLPNSGLIPVMKRTNEKALTAMVKNAEGSFVTVGGFRFYKPVKALAHEFTKGNQTWDIPAGGISPRVIQVRVNGWKITKQGLVENREADGSSRRTGSAILHVDADKWEEFGLANALQDLIDNPKSGTTGLSKSAVADLARKVQREALSYRESDGARTSKKVLFRDKGRTEEPVQQEILSESPNDSAEPEYSSAPIGEDESLFDARTDDFFEDYYEDPPYAEEPPVKSREPGEDDALVSSIQETSATPEPGSEKPTTPSESERLTNIETRLSALEQKAATQVETDLGNAGWESKPEIIHDYPDWDIGTSTEKGINIGGFHGKTAEDLAGFLADSPEVSLDLRAIAKAIIPALKGQLIRIDREGMVSPEGPRLGRYSNKTQELQFSRNFTPAAVAIHELLHAATTQALLNSPKSLRALQDFQRTLRKIANKDAATGKLSKAEMVDLKYILTGKGDGVHEVITVAFTSPALQRYLASKLLPEKTTLWGKFTSVIKKALKIPKETMLDEVFRIGNEVIDANKVILPPERLKTQIATIVPSMPRLTGYKPYMDALKDPAQAEHALQALISHNSELASAYAKAVTELHREGGVSQATLDKLFKRPCS